MTLSRSSSVIIVSLPEAAQGFRRKGWLPVPNTDWHGVACLVALVLQAFLEILISVLTAPFRKIQETPVVTCVEDNDNTSVLQAMPSLRKFVPTWWALGPFAQTVANGSRAVKNATPYTRELTVMSDGVAVALDWKTVDPALPPDAPLVVVCHGLGGHSRTNSCNGVTEALARRGWRVVVYNRRGHGGSSLLASDTATATATAYRHAAANSSTRRASEGDEGGEDSAPSIGGDATPTPTPRGTIRPIPGTGTSPSPSSSSGPVRGAAVSPQVVGRCVLSVKAFPAHVDLDDLRRVVSHVQSRYPAAPKALVGLSAGSNLVVRFQGDCAEESPFVAAASIANGHELTHRPHPGAPPAPGSRRHRHGRVPLPGDTGAAAGGGSAATGQAVRRSAGGGGSRLLSVVRRVRTTGRRGVLARRAGGLGGGHPPLPGAAGYVCAGVLVVPLSYIQCAWHLVQSSPAMMTPSPW
ncbi:hypothetical protein PLESTB_001361000 [Pleodorina starrii]|uniref:AB hydrolase-1 domain-containing protein n=1 Tax=Pleodorina starrii TaxID=330485 RepID=A0A9W6BUG8_9CHLO|nr:hypothetical protein PLESTB_001361000 [Pleodorina starrii]